MRPAASSLRVLDHRNMTPRPSTAIIPTPSRRSNTGLVPGFDEHVHLLGAGGAGVSGLARLLLARGHRVSGYDRESSAFSSSLETHGVTLSYGESTSECLPESPASIVRSAAIPDEDPQWTTAQARGWSGWSYAQALGHVAPTGRTFAVAGTHGKTTTAWMSYHALRGLAEAFPGTGQPGALVGGLDCTLGTNAIPPAKDGWFVAEACEYKRSFLQVQPTVALITNVEADHLDCYGTEEAVFNAFAQFVHPMSPDGLVVLGEDVDGVVENAASCEVWRLGRELHIECEEHTLGAFEFRLRGPGWATPKVQLHVPGTFNVSNAALALAAAVGVYSRQHGMDPEACAHAAARGLESFRGAQRRFESWGDAVGQDLVHDYAHHPTEILATMTAARRVFPGKPLHVLFQPHQHSRTAHFLSEFVESLAGADRVVVAPVYGARKAMDVQAASAEELAVLLGKAGVPAEVGRDLDHAAGLFARDLGYDVAGLVLGAGDIDTIRGDLLEQLAVRSTS